MADICNFVINEFDPTFEFKTWEAMLFKMPHFETPRFQMGTRVTLTVGPNQTVFQKDSAELWHRKFALKWNIQVCSTKSGSWM